MELNKAKTVIICAGIGGWYAKGVERLEKSLNYVGWAGDLLTWKDIDPPASRPHNEYPYYFKIAAFEWALYRQYTHILWVDASFWSIQNPMSIFDLVDSKGFYMFRSGYSMAQTINDATLAALDLSRDELIDAPEYASGCVGLNFNNPDARHLYSYWKSYMDNGYSRGSRQHDNQSQDPRFLFHRQDQSCLSIAMYKLKLSIDQPDYVAYYGSGYDPRKCVMFINGI
jgi:hypothetical protein